MRELIDTIVEAIAEKKGKNRVLIDLRAIEGTITDALIICNADSTMQVSAIVGGVEKKVEEVLGERAWRIDGLTNSLWVAMDYINVVVHVFQTEQREFYKLEQLWADAPTTRFEDEQ